MTSFRGLSQDLWKVVVLVSLMQRRAGVVHCAACIWSLLAGLIFTIFASLG